MNKLQTIKTHPALQALYRFGNFLATEAWEKIDVRAKWREIKEEGKKHGRRFVIFAVAWEFIEDAIFPIIAVKMGHPELVLFFLVMHFEPITWPTALWAFRTWDRAHGLVPWEPDRSAMSSHWRSAGKVALYKVATAGYYGLILLALGHSLMLLVPFVVLMGLFGFVHERTWHDSNYGIREDDTVERKRVIGKTITYAIVSTTILASLLKGSVGVVPWLSVLALQSVGLAIYAAHEAIWAKSKWGVVSTVTTPPATPYRAAFDPEKPHKLLAPVVERVVA